MSKKGFTHSHIAHKKVRLLHILAAVLVFLLAAVVVCLWIFRKPAIPKWAVWKTYNEEVTLSGEEIHVQLRSRRLTLYNEDGVTLWTGESEWKVSDCLLGDIDHDGEDEVILLVWKEGSFGDFKPFWLEEDEKDWSQHLFIYDWDTGREDRMKPIWMSSRMGIEAKEVFLDEENILHILTPDAIETQWAWENWGLTLLSEKETES